MKKQFDLAGVVKNRIVDRKMLKPGDLQDHPGQWRTHSEAQAAATAGVLREVGIADTLKAWYSERADGALVTWDGHLRKSLDPDLEWPVDILDITDAEANYLLATHDPLGALAGTDAASLDALLAAVNSGEEAVQKMLADLAAVSGLYDTTVDLDALADEYGEIEDEDFWPMIRVKVPPATKDKYDALLERLPGLSEAEKFDALVSGYVPAED